jgi:hypothetical protein
MKIIIQLTSEEEAKALPILLRHSPGMILPDRTYVLPQDVVGRLQRAGIRFTQLSREALAPSLEEVAGERVWCFRSAFLEQRSPIEPAKFQDLQSRLLERFEGLTYFPQANHGFWKFGEITYRDEIVIYRVISEDSAASREYLSNLKEHLKRELQQLDILIIEREVGRLWLRSWLKS